MPKRRLTLRSEKLTELASVQLESVVGAISAPNVLCVLTSVQYSQCQTCGIACTANCGPIRP